MRLLNKISPIYKIVSNQSKASRSKGLLFSGLKCTPVIDVNPSLISKKMSSNLASEKGKCDIGFVIEEFKEESIDEVKELFRSYYYSREPQCRMLNLTYEDHKDLLHDSLKEWIGKNVSVIARDRQSGKVVGCSLSTIVTPDNISSSISNSASNKNYNLKARHYMQLDDFLKNSVDLFKKYNVETILQGEMAIVIPNYGKRGMASRLIREGEKRGKSHGCQLVTGIASNIYSQKVSRSLGYTVEREIDIADLRIDGKQVLNLSKNQGTKTSQLVIRRL